MKDVEKRYFNIFKKQTTHHNFNLVEDFPKLYVASLYKRKFKEPSEWLRIQHQTAGMMCHQVKFWGYEFPLKDSYALAFKKIHRKWYSSTASAFDMTLDDYQEYRSSLKKINLDCNDSFKYLEEALYPVDFKEEYLETLSGVKIDDLYQYLLKKENGNLPFNDFCFFILEENSD